MPYYKTDMQNNIGSIKTIVVYTRCSKLSNISLLNNFKLNVINTCLSKWWNVKNLIA